MEDLKNTNEHTLGSWLREHRLRLYMTASEAASRAGISRAMWGKLEADASGTRIENIVAIARAVGADVMETYRLAGYEPPAEMMSPNRRRLLQLFNSMDEDLRDDLVTIANALVERRLAQSKVDFATWVTIPVSDGADIMAPPNWREIPAIRAKIEKALRAGNSLPVETDAEQIRQAS